MIASVDDVVDGLAANPGCALHRDGHVTCWGRNDEGQVGAGGALIAKTPPPIARYRP